MKTQNETLPVPEMREACALIKAMEALQAAQADGDQAKVTKALDKVLNAGKKAHRAIRDVVCALVEQTQGACHSYARAALRFDDFDSEQSLAVFTALVEDLLPMRIIAKLRYFYQFRTAKFDWDINSCEDLVRLWAEYQKVCSLSIKMREAYLQMSVRIEQMNSYVEGLMDKAPEKIG
jgi:hypothetical protein